MKVTWLGEGRDYSEVLSLQETLWENATSDAENFAPHLLLLEHAPVYTIGRTRDQSSLGDRMNLPHPTVEINRGGQATYHGPGQLIGYPIVNLDFIGRDLHAFVHGIEICLIRTCAEYGVRAIQREGLVGIWVEDRKLASIGVGVRKWVSMHGFAINMTKESVIPFHYITPCGISNVTMTYLEGEMKRLNLDAVAPSSLEFGETFSHHFEKLLLSMKVKEP